MSRAIIKRDAAKRWITGSVEQKRTIMFALKNSRDCIAAGINWTWNLVYYYASDNGGPDGKISGHVGYGSDGTFLWREFEIDHSLFYKFGWLYYICKF